MVCYGIFYSGQLIRTPTCVAFAVGVPRHQPRALLSFAVANPR